MLLRFVEKLWPLPAPQKRKLWWSIMRRGYLKEGIRAERDGDYLFNQAAAITTYISTIILIWALVDVWSEAGVFVNLDLVAQNKMAFIGQWGKIVVPLVYPIAILCYLRIRLSIDIQNDQIPFFFHKPAFRGKTRREWIGVVVLWVFCAFVLIPWQLSVWGNTDHANLENRFDSLHFNNELWVVIGFQIMAFVALPFGIGCGLSAALTFEKTIRFWNDAYRDMEQW